MAGHDIVRHEPRRLSRKRIREWLEAKGPQPLKEVVFQAKLQIPGITTDQVLRELEDNPELFMETEDELWASQPRQRYVVVDTKPRPRPAPRKKPVAKPTNVAEHRPSARRRTKDRRTPRQGEPITIERESVVCLTFSRLVTGPGEPLESGRHLLVPLPQSGAASPEVVESILAACLATDTTDVYELRPRVGAVYRGRRRVLHARRSPDGSRVHVVLGPGEGDEGPTFGLVRGAPQLPLLPRSGAEGTQLAPSTSGTTTELVAVYEGSTALAPLALRRAIVEATPLSQEARRAAMAPAPRHRFDRKRGTEEANRRLAAVYVDRANWGGFHEWLAKRKGEFDQEFLQDILERAINIEEVSPIEVFRLARVLVEEGSPIRPGFARAYCIRLSERLADEDAIRWAKELLPVALERAPNDSELRLANARIAAHESRYADACRLYRKVFESEPTLMHTADIEEFLFAAGAAVDASAGKEALKRLGAAVARLATPSELSDMQQALDRAIDVAVQFEMIRQAVELLEQGILLMLDQRQERKATRLYEIQAHPRKTAFRTTDRLRLLSTLTRCETPDALRNVLLLFDEVLTAEWDSIKQPDRETAVRDIRDVERLLGERDRPWSRPLEERLAAHRVALDDASEKTAILSPLAGTVIVLLGGRASTRERAERQLKLDHNVAEVRSIPPSWEASFDRESVRAKVQRADYVAEITDCIKHDALDVIQSLKNGGMSFVHVPTQGGPTRIIRDLVNRASDARSPA